MLSSGSAPRSPSPNTNPLSRAAGEHQPAGLCGSPLSMSYTGQQARENHTTPIPLILSLSRHQPPSRCPPAARQWCAQPDLAPSPLPGTLQHPAALLESQAGCDNAVERGEKKKNTTQSAFLFFFFHSQPLLCHPLWNVPPNSSLPRCVLLPALPLIVCSDCIFPTLRLMARDHPWLRAGSLSPPAQCTSTGLGKAASQEPWRGEAGAL